MAAKTLKLAIILTLLIDLCTVSNLPSQIAATGTRSKFWATVLARGKGDDYLFVVDPQRMPDKKPPRRIRCETSLSVYVEEIAKSASACDGKLMLQVEGDLIATAEEERIKDLRILAIVIVPEEAIVPVINSSDCFNFKSCLAERRKQ